MAASALIATGYTPALAAGASPAPPTAPAGISFSAKVPVIASITLPDGFAADGWPPLWFQGGELAVIGRQSGHLIVLGYSGVGFQQRRVLAPDLGPDQRNAVLLDIAEDPKQTTLAAAIGDLRDGRVEVTLRNVSEDQPTRQLARMDGRFSAAGLSWIDTATLALGLVSQPPTPESTPTSDSQAYSNPTPAPAAAEAGLYAVSLHRGWPPSKISLHCARSIDLTHTLWSPDGRHAIVYSDAAPPLLIDRSTSECKDLDIPADQRVRVLGWNPSGDRFLYAAAPAANYLGGTLGFFEYDLASGQSNVIAAPAAAATYLQEGRIAALGNRNLNPRLIARNPGMVLAAEVALIDPGLSRIQIAPLGFNTPAATLLNGSLVYSPIAEELAIQTFFPSADGNIPIILSFFPATLKARPVATGKAGSILTMSWSPLGDMLAVLDASASPPVLTVLSPPLFGAQGGSGGLRAQ